MLQELHNAHPNVAPGLTQAAVPDPLVHDALPHEAAPENLRRLAIRFLRHPDSQIDMVRMEPGTAEIATFVLRFMPSRIRRCTTPRVWNPMYVRFGNGNSFVLRPV